MLEAGAKGYVAKQSAEENLVYAIRAVARGGLYVDPEIASRMIHIRPRLQRGQGDLLGPIVVLSSREEDILRCIAFGLSHKEIADRHCINVKSVETYKSRATQKLNLTTRATIVSHAIRCGWFGQEGAQVARAH